MRCLYYKGKIITRYQQAKNSQHEYYTEDLLHLQFVDVVHRCCSEFK